MELNLTKADAERLLEMLYLGTSMANEGREEHERLSVYDSFEQRILNLLSQAGVRGVRFDEQEGRYAYTSAFQEGAARKVRTDYDDRMFWEELVDRLTHRDLERRNTVAKTEKPFAPGLDPAHDDIAARYWEEFEEFGIGRLGIWAGN